MGCSWNGVDKGASKMYHRYSTYFSHFSVSIPGWIMFSRIVCIVFLLCPTCSKNRHGLFVLQLKITNLPTTFCCHVQLHVARLRACNGGGWSEWLGLIAGPNEGNIGWRFHSLDGLEPPNWDDIIGTMSIDDTHTCTYIILCPYSIICIHICHLCKFRTFVHKCTWVQAYDTSIHDHTNRLTNVLSYTCVYVQQGLVSQRLIGY